MIVNIDKLKLNPYHVQIYTTNDITDLIESIEEVGLLEKIVVSSDFTILSGVRRYYALIELNYQEVDVEIKDVNEEDELLTLIAFNKQRVKMVREILNEAKFLKSIWAQKRGRKTGSNLSEPIQSKEPTPMDTRKKISNVLGIGATNLAKMEYIDKNDSDLIDKIDSGVYSINQAHMHAQKKEEVKKVKQLDAFLPETISNEFYTIYNKSSNDLSDIEDCSIQTIITSPPYWKIRTFTSDENEIGAEKTSEEFVVRMASHIHCCHRILKDEGSLFLNLGDSFENKCLQSIPHRIVIELIQKGWILRNTIIWKKSNPLPSSTKDNLTSSYEFIFHLVKSPNYYYNFQKIPITTEKKEKVEYRTRKSGTDSEHETVNYSGFNDSKKLEDFWDQDIVTTAIANQSIVKKYGGKDHPAPFPADITVLPILHTSRPGDIVMDLFSGSGTTGEVALLNGRKYIGYEINPNFNKMQEQRLNDAIIKYNENHQLNQAA